MSRLRFHLLARPRVMRDDGHRVQEVAIQPAAWSLLAYLLLFRERAHSRERLTDLFWRGQKEERARHCLRTTLWRLRQALGPHQCIVTEGDDQLQFEGSQQYWLDVAEFEEQTTRGLRIPLAAMTQTAADCLEQARLLYVGDLLPDHYEDWALREQERLRLLYLRGLERLIDYYQGEHQYELALECGREILEHDPLREGIHQRMMFLFLASGQRAQAVEQYNRCEAVLADELQLAPMAETQRLLTQALSTLSSSGSDPVSEPPASLQQARQQLAQAAHALDRTAQRLRLVADLISRHVEQ